MNRIDNNHIDKEQKHKKKRTKEKKNEFNFTKRKGIVITVLLAIFIAILIGIFFFVNSLIPVKDITDDNIEVLFSTTRATGRSVVANISTKTHYNIFYFIDYSAGEEKFYTDEDFSNTEEDTDTKTETKEKIEIKQISDSEYQKVKNSKLEITNNGVIYLKYERFGKLSSNPYILEVSNIDKTGPEIGEIETSSTPTSITVKVNALDDNIANLQYYFRLSSSNIYIANGSNNTYTFNDLTLDESYTIFVKVVDKFGNETEAVAEATASAQEQTEVIEKKIYHFKVNLGANTVNVYDNNQPIKSFICSTGKGTPKSGTYQISDKYRWRSLFGGVFGQYAVRICGNILFHSVPYEQMYANTLEYEEYDKLGTSASMGCVRLCVKDAKWIYDNAKTGSTVEFYSDSSNPGPLGKPKAQKISDNKAKRNWDPTDPDKHNPWLGGDGAVTKITIIDDNPPTPAPTNTVTNTTTNTTNTVENTISNNVTNSTTNSTHKPNNTTNSTNKPNTTTNSANKPNTTSNSVSNKTTNTLIITNDVIGE